jgi:hypothetical protein
MPAGRVRVPKAEAGARRPVAAGCQIPTPGIWILDPRAWQPANRSCDTFAPKTEITAQLARNWRNWRETVRGQAPN